MESESTHEHRMFGNKYGLKSCLGPNLGRSEGNLVAKKEVNTDQKT